MDTRTQGIIAGSIFGAALVICIGVVIATDAIGKTADRMMRGECYRWQRYEQQYELFELNAQDTATCALLGVTIK